MSTERDDTTPLPAQPGSTHDRHDDRHPGTAGDQATTPVPRPGPNRTDEPTLVFDTFAAEPSERITRAEPTRPIPSAPDPGPDATRPLPSAEQVTARTSAFAAAGAGAEASGVRTERLHPAASPVDAAPAHDPVPGPVHNPEHDPVQDPVQDPVPADRRPAPGDPGISTSLRVGTVVWGLILAIIGAGVVAIAAGATFDLELALIGLLALAGVALVVGSVVSASRHRR